jgi:Hydrazine synthase alpha subunit middle domain
MKWGSFYGWVGGAGGIGVLFLVCVFIAGISQDGSARTAQAEARHAPPKIVFVQAAKMSSGNLVDRFPHGSRIVRLDWTRESASARVLTENFFAAADPRPSFDGTKMLFSGQRAEGQSWQVWEMNADGSAQTRITHCPADCLRADYLPKDEIVYSARTVQEGRSEWRPMVSKRDGSNARPITFAPGDFEVETVLRNGLIVASASWPLDGKSRTTRRLYTLKPDGTDLESLRYERTPRGTQTDAAELDDGSILFERIALAGTAAGGKLEEIKPGALRGAPFGVQTAMSWSPSEFTGDELIVSRWIPGAAGAGRFDLYSMDAKTGNYRRRIFGEPHFSSVEAVPLEGHAVPKWFWSLVEPGAKAARMICLDSYLSGDGPKGRINGKIARVRVLALGPLGDHETSLGEAPVESDGSFYIAVPPDRAVRFELLDSQGRVLRAQKGWVWARAGEDRGCAGCHEDRTITPENRWPLTLKRFDTPTPLGVEGATAAKQ